MISGGYPIKYLPGLDYSTEVGFPILFTLADCWLNLHTEVDLTCVAEQNLQLGGVFTATDHLAVRVFVSTPGTSSFLK